MNRMKMALAGGAVALSMFTGRVLGAALWGTSAVAASAASASTLATTTVTATPSAASGTFVSNENATHEPARAPLARPRRTRARCRPSRKRADREPRRSRRPVTGRLPHLQFEGGPFTLAGRARPACARPFPSTPAGFGSLLNSSFRSSDQTSEKAIPKC